MNRLKLLATATLMALTFTACDEGTPPPVEPPPPPTPVGTISGTVTIEGTAASGITATLSSGATTTTGSGGSFAFSGVEAGTYTVTISGFPEDATFAQVTQSATIATDGQNVQLNFAGEYIRSSAVVGNVVAADAMMSGGDGQPETLVGVTVTLGGEHAMGETMETAEDGGFAFTGLRAGTYTVTISDFPEDVSFETVSLEIEVDVGEVGSADFTGHFIRTSAVEGQVVIEGEGLAGVTVTLSGGPADESYTMMTDADGMYRFEELRPGDYTVSISDFDTRDYEFAATSQDVSVDLDETGTVSFTGVLLRTSGIAGRVSVEGMGLGGIEVTLAGGDDSRTAMTDDGGQYAFAGLAAGDYTVSISVESAAYVFESMSTDVTLADDQSAIVNFEGAHARTASVSGMVFLDEATKNDMYDEGEHPLAHAGIPVALVGPGVNEQRLGATDATGAFSFEGLQAGPYQLVVLINATVAAALSANDVAYGGPGEGYSVALGVGEAASQAIPFDITHTTVNFTVSLKHGDDMGAALPGATVTLYSGENKVGGGDTGEDGSVMIKVARAGTSGNMVMAGVSADGYDVADGMTEVSWDPQMFATAAGNSNDIVNLNVDATVSGATITTDYGGGKALAGWAIGVTMGDDAVEGAPEMLDDDGNASFMTTVGKDDLPATFTFAVADDQDNKMDGGESYDGADVEYEHTGLALAGTMDAGTIEVAYSTQTLKVYVHHERDQRMGYSGSVLAGDSRDEAGNVDVGLRFIDGNGRSRAITKAMWDAAKNTSDSKGVWTFSHVPADMNIVANASEADDAEDIKILDPDELAAYTGMEENGITGGAFGDNGGFHHTVELCPLQTDGPQDPDACASFAYVTTHTVSGLVWKDGVTIDSKTDGFKMTDPTRVPGITVELSPVEGSNLAGEEESYTTAEKDNDKTDIDERVAFSFGGVAAGAYKVSVPDGWRYRIGGKDADAEDDGEFSPLNDDVSIDVTPSTATLYGYVMGGDGFALAGATVTANNMSTTTDDHGRYVLEGIVAETRKIGSTTHKNSVFVKAAAEGQNPVDVDPIGFAANSPTQKDIDLSAVTNTITISGTVTANGSNAPIAGVEIKVDGVAPLNKATKGTNAGKLVTAADGTYSADVQAKEPGDNVTVSAAKAGWTFPYDLTVPGHADQVNQNFVGFREGTIRGRVVAPGGGPLAGVTVTATEVGAAADADPDATVTTTDRGTFSLSVPWGNYTIAASLDTDDDGTSDYAFNHPRTSQEFQVAPGATRDYGDIKAPGADFRVTNVKATRATATGAISVTWSSNEADETGLSATFVAQVCTASSCGDDDWKDTDVTASTDPATAITTVGGAAVGGTLDGSFRVRVAATLALSGGLPTGDDAPVVHSSVASLGGVDPRAEDVKATRGVDAASADTIGVTWNATTTTSTEQRVVIQVQISDSRTEWLLPGGTITPGTAPAFSWELDIPAEGTDLTWNLADGNGTITVTRAALLKALSIRVDSRHGSTGDWMMGGTANLAAKP